MSADFGKMPQFLQRKTRPLLAAEIIVGIQADNVNTVCFSGKETGCIELKNYIDINPEKVYIIYRGNPR